LQPDSLPLSKMSAGSFRLLRQNNRKKCLAKSVIRADWNSIGRTAGHAWRAAQAGLCNTMCTRFVSIRNTSDWNIR